ncbi:MAG: hypothetical protein ACKVWV_15255 [Planctomycetota bacterium]
MIDAESALQVGELFFAPVAAMASCELVLRGSKLQSRLLPVVAIHAGFALFALLWLGRDAAFAWGPAVVLWAGAFLVWFGVRSHVESSILLAMLRVLHEHGSMSEAELLARYREHHGASARLDELRRGGYIESTAGTIVVTHKGRTVARAFALLARWWRLRA